MGLVTNIVLAQVVVGLIAVSILGVTSSDDPAAVYVGVISDLAWLGFLALWLQQRHPGWRERIGIPTRVTGLRDAVYGWIAGLMSERCAGGGHFILFGSNYQDVFAFVVLILVLIFRPSGLLGERVADRA